MAIPSKISTCGNNGCQFCMRGSLDTDIKFYANCTNTEYMVDFDVTCKTECCVYLLTCKCCNIKYVGKTWNSIITRFNGHRGHMRCGTEAYLMNNHFCGVHGHGIPNMIVKPIELCAKKDLIKREKFWMAELNTLFPYGLNMEANFKDVVDAYLLVTDNTSRKTIYSTFNKKVSKRTSRGGHKQAVNGNDILRRNEPNFISKVYIEEIIEFASSSSNFVYAIRTRLLMLKVCQLKHVFLETLSMINEKYLGVMQFHEYCIYFIKDICLFKLSASYKDKVGKPNNFVVVKFANKLVENINLQKILRQQNIKSLFPVKDSKVALPSVSYERTQSIRSKVLNYKETLMDTNFADFTCKCGNYDDSFKDTHHQHIITGNLNIVKNNQLKKLLEKGLNFMNNSHLTKL